MAFELTHSELLVRENDIRFDVLLCDNSTVSAHDISPMHLKHQFCTAFGKKMLRRSTIFSVQIWN